MSTFQVALKRVVDDSYPIEIGFDLQSSLIADVKNGIFGDAKRLAVITDTNVLSLYAQPIAESLHAAGFAVEVFSFTAGEEQKTRETKAALEDAMLDRGFRRDCAVIAVGGGVVTDMAGFLAGTFARGVPFVNYATTLLAAADASVGGKTAVDTPLATNLIGLFNQPKKVYIDVAAWKTLPMRQISSGMAETVKHACLADKNFFKFLEDNISKIMSGDTAACTHMAEENCRIKYEIVMKDERESGLREVLNLGHTVGRAIETVSGYRLLHGEAVAIGLAAETELACRLGTITADEQTRVLNLLKAANLPTAVPKYVDTEELVKKLYTDKKVKNGKLRFVVQNGIGSIKEFESGVFAVPIAEQTAREIIETVHE